MRPACRWVMPRSRALVQPEVGVGRAGAARDARAHQHVAGEVAACQLVEVGLEHVGRQQRGVRRHHHAAGQPGQPVGRHGRERRVGEGLGARARDDELVPRELRVALPLEAEGAEVGAVVRCPRGRRRGAVPPRELADVLAFALAQRGVRVQGEEGEPQRRRQRLGRPCVDFLVEREAQRVVGRQPHGASLLRRRAPAQRAARDPQCKPPPG